MAATSHTPEPSPVASPLRPLTPAEVEIVLANDPLLTAVGIAQDLWADEHADEYVARLRQGW